MAAATLGGVETGSCTPRPLGAPNCNLTTAPFPPYVASHSADTADYSNP
jgi:hypothetical protein